MEIDVLYRAPKDLCWRYIKQIAKPESIGMIVYRACIDNYVTSRTIWAALTRLSPDGLLCIECLPENISPTIECVSKAGYRYITIPVVGINKWAIYVIAYASEVLKPKCGKLIRIDNWDNLGHVLVNLSQLDDIILLIGDMTLPFVSTIRCMGRHVIAMGDDPIYCAMVHNDGLREEQLIK